MIFVLFVVFCFTCFCLCGVVFYLVKWYFVLYCAMFLVLFVVLCFNCIVLFCLFDFFVCVF